MFTCAIPSSKLMQESHPNLVTRTTRHSFVFKTVGWKITQTHQLAPESEAWCKSLTQAVILKGWLLLAKEQRLLSFTFYTFSFCFYSLELYKETIYTTDYAKLFFYPNKMLLWLQLPNPILSHHFNTPDTSFRSENIKT